MLPLLEERQPLTDILHALLTTRTHVLTHLTGIAIGGNKPADALIRPIFTFPEENWERYASVIAYGHTETLTDSSPVPPAPTTKVNGESKETM